MGMFRKAGGGGFLNGVDGKIVSYEFDSTVWNKGKDNEHTSLSVELQVQPDGADEPVKQFPGAGFLYEGQSISKDGKTLESEDSGPIIRDDSEFARFITTLVDAGFPEADFDEDGRNFEAMEGKRVTFAKEPNPERQRAAGKNKLKKLGKAKGATEEEIMEAGKRVDPNDKKKKYNHDRLIVTALLDDSDEKEESKKKDTKGGKKEKKGKKGKKAKGEDVEALAQTVLLELLKEADDNTIRRSAVSSLIVRKALADDIDTETREALRKLIHDEDFLKKEDGWSYDGDSKKQEITLDDDDD